MPNHANISELQIDNLPNRLTIFRVLLIPFVLVTLMLSGSQIDFMQNFRSQFGWLAAWIFVLASMTDFFDGWIARKKNLVTVFGSFLDPIADKFLIVSSLIMLQSLDRIPVLIVIILVLREMYITSLRLLAINQGVSVPVVEMGKWKTATQMLGIPLLMANESWLEIPIPFIGTLLIYLACILSLWSAIHYTYNMIQKLKQKKELKKEKKEDPQGESS
ncbi:MAG: CDP-diacylglycerol--glycerol-3-phosphate 3-phosphatidyltransferase [Halobacteriovoraceae bacterium]|jgi:CDP-diacylglycerol--glycerol-3-phosphate 3-phosphatidyltransferase|nr:CDP-diacylglycerol--glycerol-3-phosphate 3-phosphatidyltransferase [Halobacteriovoraceae bacterium]